MGWWIGRWVGRPVGRPVGQTGWRAGGLAGKPSPDRIFHHLGRYFRKFTIFGVFTFGIVLLVVASMLLDKSAVAGRFFPVSMCLFGCCRRLTRQHPAFSLS